MLEALPAAHERAVAMFKSATPPMDAPIETWRKGFETLCASFAIPESATITPFRAGDVAGLSVRMPEASLGHAVLHYHSGGYVMGSARDYRNFACRLSAVTGATVLLPEYRLAPEHPFPAAIDDALTAYRWALDRFGSAKLALSGDSAGGGLCIATLLQARAAGLALPCCAAAISPLLDLAGEGQSTVTNDGIDPLINRTMIVEMGKVYIGNLDPHKTPLASPLWGQHHGLPPLHLTASTTEVLRDDAARLAESVRQAGGSVEARYPEGMVHIWTLFPFLAEAEASLDAIGSFVRRHLGT